MSYMRLGPATRGAVSLWAALCATALAAGALVLGLVGASVGVSLGSSSAGIAWRGALSLLFVLLAARICVERAVVMRVPSPPVATIAVSVAGFLLDPLTWDARTALTQLVVEPGLATVVGDLALWLVVSFVGVLWGMRNAEALQPRQFDGRW